MAEPQEKLDLGDLQDTFLECPVCVDIFNQTDRRPRLLQTCLHAFCTQCLDQLLQREGRGQVTCPVCRHVEKIKGTADSLRVDPVRSKLIDYVQMKQTKQFSCTECGENVAVSQCKECKCFLCEECDFVHRRHRVSRGHKISSLEDVMNQPLKNLSKGHFCEIHQQHQIEFYCTTDGKLCCVSCTVVDHKGHDLKKLKEFAEAKKLELEKDIKKMQHLAQDLQDANLEAKRQEKTIEDTKTKSVADISSMFDDLYKSMAARKQQLVDEVLQRSSSLSSAVKKSVEANEQTLAIIESTQTYFTQTKDKADHTELMQMYPSIKRSIGALGSQEEVPDFHVSLQGFRFQKERVNDVTQLIPRLGGFDEGPRRMRGPLRGGARGGRVCRSPGAESRRPRRTSSPSSGSPDYRKRDEGPVRMRGGARGRVRHSPGAERWRHRSPSPGSISRDYRKKLKDQEECRAKNIMEKYYRSSGAESRRHRNPFSEDSSGSDSW